jgi:HK97 gp10 family phage protein
MGSISTIGLDGLISDMERLAVLPDSVLDDMLNAGADVLEKAQERSAQTMLGGPYSKGVTAKAIKRTKSKKAKNGRSLEIYPQGSRTGPRSKKSRRNAEVAFVNEFGKRGQPARPFIKAANDAATSEVTEAVGGAMNAFLDKLNL